MRQRDLIPLAVVILAGIFCVLTVVAYRAVDLSGVCPPASTTTPVTHPSGFGAPERMEPAPASTVDAVEAVPRMGE